MSNVEKAEKFKELGNEQFKKQKWQDAINYYSKAIEENPNEASYYSNRSACYLQLKRFTNAIEDGKKCTSKDPKFMKGYFRTAQALLMIGKTSEAARECQQALIHAPGNKETIELQQKIEKVGSYLEKGTKHLANNEFQEALNQFESALQIAPQSTQLQLMKADALLGLRKVEEAEQIAETVLSEDNSNPEACFIRGKALYYKGSPDVGLKFMNKALQFDPDFKKALLFRKKIKQMESLKEEGNQLFKNGDSQAAFDKYGEAIQVDPLAASIASALHCNRSAAAMKMNKYDLAEREATKAVELDPSYLKAYLRRGECYMKQEMYEEALRDFSKASELEPSNTQIKQKLKEVQRLYKAAKKKDYYKILEVDKNADEETIRKAYKKKAVQWHPDKFVEPEEKKKAEAVFKDIGEAYSVLSDSNKRRRYDMGADDIDGGGFGGFESDVDVNDIFRMVFGMGGGMGGMGGFSPFEGGNVRFTSSGSGGSRRGGQSHPFFHFG